MIENWFARVPEGEQKSSLRSRFRSESDFSSDFQELCLHELLVRQQCTVVFHPPLDGSGNHPDYRVLQPDGREFLLEATSSSAVSTGPANNPRRNRIADRLQQFRYEGFSLGIDELTAGGKDLRWKEVEKHIKSELAKIPRGTRCVSIPLFDNRDGWTLKLTAIRTLETADSGSIRYEGWSRSWVSPSAALHPELRKKGGRYGDPNMPFVLAVNSWDVMCSSSDFCRALFGDSNTTGFWGSSRNPQYRRVSAVLFSINLWPATILMGQAYACLYLNPWAHRPYEGVLTKLQTITCQDGSLQRKNGAPIHRLLGVDPLDSSLWN